MSARLDAQLRAQMARWESSGLRRELDAQPPTPFAREREFASNDYLSFARDPRVVDAAREALAQHGAGGRAARLLGGGSELDRRAERACAEWLGEEEALLFPSGWQANAGVIGALCGRGDAVVSDALNHASIIDGAKGSRARVLVFAHNDLDALDRRLGDARGARRRIVVVESVFSMDGDVAPLGAIHEICVKHDALLVVDEAHATGLIGPRGAGAWAAARLDDSHLGARIVTGGKALGVGGAFVVGTRALRDHLVNHARAFVFTTAVSPAVSGALVAAIELARGSTERAERALDVAKTIAARCNAPAPASVIVPIVVGDNARALELASRCRERGLDVRAVRPPTVPEGTARLRISCHAHNDAQAIDDLVATLAPALAAPRQDTVQVRRPLRAIAVVGTDTDVGKTVVSAILARASARRGRAAYWKPVQTGTESDTDEVKRLTADLRLEIVPPEYELPLAASPHSAAAAAGVKIDFNGLCAKFGAVVRAPDRDTLVIELAGGLIVPLDDRWTQADWLVRTGVEVVLVARTGLGTLNHTLLSLEALRSRSIEVRALFLVGDTHAANAATLRQRSGVDAVYEVPRFSPLVRAPLDAWIAENDVGAVFDVR